jgi:hypothetical protein
MCKGFKTHPIFMARRARCHFPPAFPFRASRAASMKRDPSAATRPQDDGQRPGKAALEGRRYIGKLVTMRQPLGSGDGDALEGGEHPVHEAGVAALIEVHHHVERFHVDGFDGVGARAGAVANHHGALARVGRLRGAADLQHGFFSIVLDGGHAGVVHGFHGQGVLPGRHFVSVAAHFEGQSEFALKIHFGGRGRSMRHRVVFLVGVRCGFRLRSSGGRAETREREAREQPCSLGHRDFHWEPLSHGDAGIEFRALPAVSIPVALVFRVFRLVAAGGRILLLRGKIGNAGREMGGERRRGANCKFEISERAKAKKAAHAPRPGEPGRMKAVASHRTPKRRGGLQN